MQVRVGIRETARELVIETDQSQSDIEKQLDAAVAQGAAVLKLSDKKGQLFLVPTTSIAYLEIGSATERKVGFIG